MAWQWFHRLGSPKWFYDRTQAWLPWLGAVAIIAVAVGCIWGLGFAPPDKKQGHSFRIMYIHFPSAGLAMSGYIMMAVAGAIGLIWKMKMAFVSMKCIAPLGATFTFLCLFTGAFWGAPTWGTYWVADARIISTLLLLFLYLGVIALQESYRHNQAMADKASAILSIVGVVNIPIIYGSVDWWFTLHQPATIKLLSASTIHTSMLQPLIVTILGFYVLFAWLLIRYIRVEILHREQKTKWVKEELGV